MKNRLLLFFVLAAFVLSATLPASTVFAAAKTAELVEFKHVRGKGWTAVFKVGGDWKPADLKGNTITVGGKPYDLYCNFRDENHISCTMHHDIGQKIGRSANFNIAGLGVYNTYITGVVPQKSKECYAWLAEFSHGYHEESWLEMYLFLAKTYMHTWEYQGGEMWGTVLYGENTPLNPSYYSLYLEINGYSWLNGKSWIESGSLEEAWFDYNHLGKCADWIDEPLAQASYDYLGWAEWSGEGEEVCVGTNCWLIDEQWEEHNYEDCESEDGSCFAD